MSTRTSHHFVLGTKISLFSNTDEAQLTEVSVLCPVALLFEMKQYHTNGEA